jgi:hypothetical protein
LFIESNQIYHIVDVDAGIDVGVDVGVKIG